MKMMKWALLGGAALAVTATAAQADDLADLKAQIEALQNRVTQLESQPQAAQPAGYSLLAIRDGQGNFNSLSQTKYSDMVRDDEGFTLSVMPTADVAPVAEVSVSGEIRTALVYTDSDFSDDESIDVANRGRIFIRGKAETAVGEVGGSFRLEASGGGDFSDYSENTRMNKAWGYWKFAPEWELKAGYDDNTAALQTSWDWNVSSIPIRTVGPSNINNEQFRLTYASGPLSFAIAVEDPDNITLTEGTGVFAPTGCTGGDAGADGDCVDAGEVITFTEVEAESTIDRSDIPNIQANLMYATDGFTAQLAGLYQDDEHGSDDWAIGGGILFGIAEGFTVVAGAVFGEGTESYANNLGPATNDDDFWGASGGVIATLSEDTRLELGVGYEDYDIAGEAFGVNGGIFWDPVSQVTLGLGATYVEFDNLDELVDDDDEADSLQVFFGTWLRFP